MDQMEEVFGLLFSGPERLLRAYQDRDLKLFRWDTPTGTDAMLPWLSCPSPTVTCSQGLTL